MKYTTFLLMTASLLSTTGSYAQSWNIGGNNVNAGPADQLLGITGPNNKNLVFINGNSGGIPVERGRITSTGFWGIGTTAPNSRFHINAPMGQTPFRVQIDGSSKFHVNTNGGVTVGASNVPPENGLLVWGNTRVGSGTFANDVRMQVLGGNDVALTTGGYYVAGSVSSTNLAIDDNEIMARNNGAASILYMNAAGGDINFSNSRMFIDASSGNVGVGTTVPFTDFHIRHATGSGSNAGLRIENEEANDEDWTFYTQNGSGELTLYENGNLRGMFDDVSGVYSSLSDARFKKNIEKAGAVLKDVLQLDVKKYHFLSNSATDKKYYGLLAQEVEKSFPEIVKLNKTDDGKEIYSMDYSAFGVLAIKAIQEQQQQTDDQRKEIDELKQMISRLITERASGSKSNIAALSAKQSSAIAATPAVKGSVNASLEQNMPNPFNQATTIRYTVPVGTAASIVVYNTSGVMVKNIKANASGIAIVHAGELAAGTYTYSLIVNGKTTASKKMILIR